MKKAAFFILFFVLVLQFSCRKNFKVYPSHGDFSVSTDTLFLDSVFTNISSPTYSFKIYNRSGKTIKLEKVETDKGMSTFFRFNVDGQAGKTFSNVIIPPEDSIYVFVEFTADISRLSDPVYEEHLLISDAAITDTVLLTAFVKDAYFLYPKRFADKSVDSIQVGTYEDGRPIRVAGFMVQSDTTITADKPTVIYGHLGVAPGKTLTVEPGAHIYFHFNSGIIVYENASLHINGALGNEVILEDDRMQPDFENVPGMWNFIWLKEGSVNNHINYAVIKNAVAGVIAYPPNSNGDPVLEISNTQIYNMSAYGLIAIASKVSGYNLVFNNFGGSALSLQLGGNYTFSHCTFANYSNAIRNLPLTTVYVNNFYKTYDSQGNETVLVNDLNQCNISNSIIYGNRPVEFYAEKNNNAVFHFFLSHNLVKFNDPQNQLDAPYLDWNNSAYFDSNVLNDSPDFESTDENKMRIGLNSAAISIGDPAVTAQFPLDILGTDRTGSPDAGAYKHTDLSQ